jgi:hypothetical protein
MEGVSNVMEEIAYLFAGAALVLLGYIVASLLSRR